MLSFVLVAFALAVVPNVTAHPGGHAKLSPRELEEHRMEARERHFTARSCAQEVSAFHAKRKARRALKKREALARPYPAHIARQAASSTLSAQSPHFTTLQNWTCVTAPEVTEGPYYINNELVRGDLTEDQVGVPLILDIGLLDINTCEPLSNAFVEIWAANASGVYGGYPAQLGGGGGEGGGAVPSGSAAPSDSGAPTDSASMGPPSGSPGGGGGGGMASTPLERNETWLRGGYTTNEQGIVELKTLYPGFYSGRTAHIHTMVHLDYEINDNGTIVSHAGNLLHIGQFFFEESWNEKVFALGPYANNTNSRTYNDEDSILEEENADGNNSFLDLEALGDDLEVDGILGYITVGVDASQSYSIMNTNFLNSTDADAAIEDTVDANADATDV